MRMALEPVGLFITQSPQDARRYAVLGAAKDRVTVGGNLKWDLGAASPNGASPEQLRALLGMSGAQKLWTAGSTHPGEERMIFEVYGRLKGRYPALRLLVAPRHPERAAEVEQEARRAGMKAARWSELKEQKAEGSRQKAEIILLDTVGELASFYGISEIVFVGGSLVPRGGHNLVEPASLGRPILTGPHLENFQAIAESLRQAKGMLVVRTSEELEQAAGRLLQDPSGARDLGARAQAVFRENQGAVKRTADLIMLRWGKALSS
jgi:3-deoxy-D-manno-octulosonic-acid transferase